MSRAAIVSEHPPVVSFEFSSPDSSGKRLIIAFHEGVEIERDSFDPDGRFQREKFTLAIAEKLPPTIDGNGKSLIRRDDIEQSFLRAFDDCEAQKIKRNVVSMSDVQSDITQWLWQDRLPDSAITLADGDPASGKSLITLDIVARVSSGRGMPGEAPAGTYDPANCMILSTEDHLSQTIRPRLDAANADLSRVFAFRELERNGESMLPTLPTYIDEICEEIEQRNIRLVVFDVLSAYYDSGINANADSDIRRALSPLSRRCEELGFAAIGIRHLNKKSGQSALHRGGGSIAISGAARCVWLAGCDPDDKSSVLGVSKSNLARRPRSLRYTIEENFTGVPLIKWGSECELTADEILPDAKKADRKPNMADECAAFIRDTVAGGTMESDSLKDACLAAGFSESTYKRGRSLAGAKSYRDGFGDRGTWFTTLNGHWDPLAKGAQLDE